MTAHTGNYSHFGLSFKGFAPEIEQAFDTGVFPAVLLEKYTWLRQYAEDKNVDSTLDSSNRDSGNLGGLESSVAPGAVDLEEEADRLQDDRDDHIDGRPF